MFYIAAAVIISFIAFCGSRKKPLKTAAAAVFSGTAALIAAHFIGMSFGITVTVNLFTASLSACAGIPFVLFLVLWSIRG